MIGTILLYDVKVCTSSRPWVQFEDAFQSRPSLLLEKLTHNDIEHYVQAQFASKLGFRDREQENPNEAQQLIKDVISKASGVFLWVRLVTEALLEGCVDGERVGELRVRLDKLPGDLEQLFGQILAQLKDSNRTKTSRMLQIIRGAVNQLDLLTFSYAEDADVEYAACVPIMVAALIQSEARARNMRRRLRAYTKGLLEAEPLPGQPLSDAKPVICIEPSGSMLNIQMCGQA